MLKKVPFKKEENFVDITGTIKNIGELRYVKLPHLRPLISFEIDSFRKRKSVDDEWVTDTNKVVLFDDESFLDNYKEGERVRIKGEVQSRNYTREENIMQELLPIAVKNCVEFFEEYPSLNKPVGKMKQPVHWQTLVDHGLLPENKVPEDSMYLIDGTKQKTSERKYVYRVDENGDLSKETEHVTYEILVRKYERLEEAIHPIRGDKNKVVLCGPATKEPRFDLLGKNNSVPFSSFTIKTKSRILDGKIFYNNVISWANLAEDIFSDVKRDTIVHVVGRLQSRTYEKELTKRWKTPSGNKKKKSKVFEFTTYEVSASKVNLCFKKKDKKKEE